MAMKISNFTYCELGASIDLSRMMGHLLPHYPNSSLDNIRNQKILTVHLVQGPIDLEGESGEHRAVAYIWESGRGLIVNQFHSPKPLSKASDPMALTGSQPQAMQAMHEFILKALGLSDIADLHRMAADRQRIETLYRRTGIHLHFIGLDAPDVYFLTSQLALIEEPDLAGLDAGAASAVGQKGREVFWSGQQLWCRKADQELWEDVLLISMRELTVKNERMGALQWMDLIHAQLAKLRGFVEEKNEMLWSEEQQNMERTELHYRIFANRVQSFLCRTAQMTLRAVDEGRWEAASAFARTKGLLKDALEHIDRETERIKRPFEFLEFRLLKAGVEELESRILLLTGMLVMMEVFAYIIEPGHWAAKGLLFGLIVLIPLAYLLWERGRLGRRRRRARALLLARRREELEEIVSDIEQRISELKAQEDLSADFKAQFLPVYQSLAEGYRKDLDRLERK